MPLSGSIHRTTAAFALLMLFVLAMGRAQTPAREGNTWGWRHHQPTRTGVQRRVRAAGVAPGPSQQKALNGQVEQLDKQLLGGRPGNAVPAAGSEGRPPR